MPSIGVIADDLTGASDIGGMLTRAGARSSLLVGVPRTPATVDADALIVALKSRSAPVPDAVAQSLAALAWLRAAGAQQIVLKVCSTFDSTPQGNIGPVTEALLDALAAEGAPVCPAFPANKRTVYQGHLFVGDRLLNESGMERHPLNPMTDPDLRRWLARQMKGAVGHLGLNELRGGKAAQGLRSRFVQGDRAVICDAIEDADLLRLAAAARGLPLIVGGSAVALGLPANFGIGADTTKRPHPRPPAAKGVILAGSCSVATLSQIEAHAARHPVLRVRPDDMQDIPTAHKTARAFLAANRDRRPLVASSDAADRVAAAQARYGRDGLASRLDSFFARLAQSALADGFRAIVVAGGETSGAVAAAVATGPLDIGDEIAPGVPTLYPGDGSFGLVLKSGNFGGPDFFDAALDALEAGR